MLRSLAVLGCALLVGCASTPKKPAEGANVEGARTSIQKVSKPPQYLTPPEIIDWLEKSPVSYVVDPRDSPAGGWADELWPQRVQAANHPQVVEKDGERVIRDWAGDDPRAKALLDEAEPHFQAERYAEAGKLYARATELCPGCYMAWTFRGDAAYFAGDAETGLKHYRKAAGLNPHDHRLWFFQGNALAKLGRYQEALEAWAWCLVLNPRYPVIRTFFRNNPGLGLVILDDAIVPRGYARREGEKVLIHYDPSHGAAWLTFASCKALWIGEPEHRRQMTGTTKEQFTSVEELECLTSALLYHAVQKQQAQEEKGEEGTVDPSLDRLSAIQEDGMLLEAVLFEVGARVHPHFSLTVDDETRQELKAYVLKHVLVPAGTSGSYDL